MYVLTSTTYILEAWVLGNLVQPLLYCLLLMAELHVDSFDSFAQSGDGCLSEAHRDLG